jgi:hypothetical protein
VYRRWWNSDGIESVFKLSVLSLLVAAKKCVLTQYYEQETHSVLNKKMSLPLQTKKRQTLFSAEAFNRHEPSEMQIFKSNSIRKKTF